MNKPELVPEEEQSDASYFVELAGLRTFAILLVIATVLINEDQIVTYFVTYY